MPSTPSSPDPRPDPRPVLGVSVAIWRDGHVLLIRRGQAPFRDHWSLPGGRVHFGERMEDAARREVLEETGLAVGALRLASVLDTILPAPDGGTASHHAIITFAAPDPGGEPRAGDDAAEVRWCTEDDLAALPTTPDLARVVALTRP